MAKLAIFNEDIKFNLIEIVFSLEKNKPLNEILNSSIIDDIHNGSALYDNNKRFAFRGRNVVANTVISSVKTSSAYKRQSVKITVYYVNVNGKWYYTTIPAKGDQITVATLVTTNGELYNDPNIHDLVDVGRIYAKSVREQIPKIDPMFFNYLLDNEDFRPRNVFTEKGLYANIISATRVSQIYKQRSEYLASRKNGFLKPSYAETKDEFDKLYEEYEANMVVDNTIADSIYTKVDVDTILDVPPKKDIVIDVEANNEALTCRHNNVNLNLWLNVKDLAREDAINNRFICMYCDTVIACKHVELMHNDVANFGWMTESNGNFDCRFCQQHIGHQSLFSIDKTVDNFVAYIRKLVMSSIQRALGYFHNTELLHNSIERVKKKLIYSAVLDYETKLKARVDWDIKHVTVAYGVMFTILYCAIYLKDEYKNIAMKEDNRDLLKLNTQELKKFIEHILIQLTVNKESNMTHTIVKLYVLNEFDNVVNTLNKEFANKSKDSAVSFVNPVVQKRKLKSIMNTYNLKSNIQTSTGITDRVYEETVKLDKRNYTGTLKVKNKLIEPQNLIDNRYNTEPACNTVELYNSMHVIYGCQGDLDQAHDWESNPNSDSCARCKIDYKQLLKQDDSLIAEKFKYKKFDDIFKTLYISDCPAIKGKHNGDPCINCNWPNIDMDFRNKYMHTLYTVIDPSKVILRTPMQRTFAINDNMSAERNTKNKTVFQHIVERIPYVLSANNLLLYVKLLLQDNAKLLEIDVNQLSDIHDNISLSLFLFNSKINRKLILKITSTKDNNIYIPPETDDIPDMTRDDLDAVADIRISEQEKADDENLELEYSDIEEEEEEQE